LQTSSSLKFYILKRYEDGSVNLQSEDCYANLMALLSVPRSQQADLLETSLERR